MFHSRRLLIVFFVLFFFSNLMYAQYLEKNYFANNSKERQNYFTVNDSVYASSIVFNNKLAYSSVKTGLISGALGAAITFGAIYISTVNKDNCDMGCGIALTMGPILIGSLSFLAGTTISYLINSNNAYINPNQKESFNQFSFSISIPMPLPIPYIPRSPNGKFTFGISYRNLNTIKYLPNRISLLYGISDLYYSYASNTLEQGYFSLYGKESTISIEMVNIDYNKVLSFMYGIEIGAAFVNAHSVKLEYKEPPETNSGNEYYVEIPYKNTTAPAFDIILGVNSNLFSWLSWDLVYKIELYGAYRNLKPKNMETKHSVNQIITSLSVCF